MESPITAWVSYCEGRGYNPRAQTFPWRVWQLQKRQKTAYEKVEDEIEERTAGLAGQTILQTLKAVKSVPDALGGMLQVTAHQVSEWQKQIKYDLDHQAEYQQKLIEWQQSGLRKDKPPKRRFRAYPQDLLFVSKALTELSERLYSSLGIDNSAGIKVDQWMKMVEDAGTRVEVRKGSTADKDLMQVTVLGSKEIRGTLQEAFEKYLDKPRIIEAVPIEPEPAEEIAPREEEDDGETDPS